MDNWQFFQTIFTMVTQPLWGAKDLLVASTVGYVRGPLLAGVTLWIGIQGYLVAYQGSDMMKLIRDVVRVAVIVTAVTSVAAYNQNISDVALTIPREVGNALGRAGSGMAEGMAHDAVLNRAIKAGLITWDRIPSFSMRTVLLTPFVFGFVIVAFFIIGGGFGVYLVSTVMLGILLGVGPLFVALYPFEITRRFALGWLAGVATAIVTQVFSVAVLAALVAVEEITLARIVNSTPADGGNFWKDLISLVGCSFLLYLIYRAIHETSQVAARIGGGIHHRINDIAAAPMAALSSGARIAAQYATGGARSAYNAATGGGGSNGGGSGNISRSGMIRLSSPPASNPTPPGRSMSRGRP